ncbi:hypothetical protein HYT55_00085 [Candidatus Woesearchaeota archaeon]|nr:hypothetical protein [Candidatus Woesearchaeota archaeon]
MMKLSQWLLGLCFAVLFNVVIVSAVSSSYCNTDFSNPEFVSLIDDNLCSQRIKEVFPNTNLKPGGIIAPCYGVLNGVPVVNFSDNPDTGVLRVESTAVAVSFPSWENVLCPNTKAASATYPTQKIFDSIVLASKCIEESKGQLTNGQKMSLYLDCSSTNACLGSNEKIVYDSSTISNLICLASVSTASCNKNNVGFVKNVNNKFDAVCYNSPGTTKYAWGECNVDGVDDLPDGGFSLFSAGVVIDNRYLCTSYKDGTTQYESWAICPSTLKKPESDGVNWQKTFGVYICDTNGWLKCTAPGTLTSDKKYLCQVGLNNALTWVNCPTPPEVPSLQSSDGTYLCGPTGWVLAGELDSDVDGVVDGLDYCEGKGVLGKVYTTKPGFGCPVGDMPPFDGSVNKNDLEWIKQNPAQFWSLFLKEDIKNLNSFIQMMMDHWIVVLDEFTLPEDI